MKTPAWILSLTLLAAVLAPLPVAAADHSCDMWNPEYPTYEACLVADGYVHLAEQLVRCVFDSSECPR